MAMDKKCGNDTEKGCPGSDLDGGITTLPDEWLEEDFLYGFRRWHIMFLSMAAVLSFIIFVCCCLKFRIPRTKQEIEGDYVRRRILRKFRQRLKAIQNQELDEMDLKRALDKIRAEFKSDTESLAQSEAGFSVATISSTGLPGHHHGQSSTYRRASQIQIDISLEDLRAQSMGIGARLALAISRFFGRSKVSQSDVPLGENGTLVAGNGNKANKGDGKQGENIKPTTITPNTKTQPSKLASVSVTIPEDVASNSKEKADKKSKGKSKDPKGNAGQGAAPAVENVEAKVVTEKNNKRNSKNKDDVEKGKLDKPENNKADKEKEKEKQEKAEKLKVDKEKEKKDKLEKEREKKEKLDKEKKEKKEKEEKDKKEKAEREKKEKAAKSKDKAKTSVVKENDIKKK